MARSEDEVRFTEEAVEAMTSTEVTREALTAYARATAIYFTRDWENWMVMVRAELEKRTDALIDAYEDAEKARLQGMCHTLRWILRQKDEAEQKIRDLRIALSEAEASLPVAGGSRAQVPPT